MSPSKLNALGEDVSLIARALMKYRLLVPAAAVGARRPRSKSRPPLPRQRRSSRWT